MHTIATNPTHYAIYRYIDSMKSTIIDMQGWNIVPAVVWYVCEYYLSPQLLPYVYIHTYTVHISIFTRDVSRHAHTYVHTHTHIHVSNHHIPPGPRESTRGSSAA